MWCGCLSLCLCFPVSSSWCPCRSLNTHICWLIASVISGVVLTDFSPRYGFICSFVCLVTCLDILNSIVGPLNVMLDFVTFFFSQVD